MSRNHHQIATKSTNVVFMCVPQRDQTRLSLGVQASRLRTETLCSHPRASVTGLEMTSLPPVAPSYVYSASPTAVGSVTVARMIFLKPPPGSRHSHAYRCQHGQPTGEVNGRSQPALVWTPALAPISYEILENRLSFQCLHFLTYKWGMILIPVS